MAKGVTNVLHGRLCWQGGAQVIVGDSESHSFGSMVPIVTELDAVPTSRLFEPSAEFRPGRLRELEELLELGGLKKPVELLRRAAVENSPATMVLFSVEGHEVGTGIFVGWPEMTTIPGDAAIDGGMLGVLVSDSVNGTADDVVALDDSINYELWTDELKVVELNGGSIAVTVTGGGHDSAWRILAKSRSWNQGPSCKSHRPKDL